MNGPASIKLQPPPKAAALTIKEANEKLLCILMALTMVLSVLPAAAAAEGDLPIDEAHFPGCSESIAKYDADQDGVLSQAERNDCTSLNLYETDIADGSVLQYFPNLDRVVLANCPNLKEVDLSSCQELTTLNVSECPLLTKLTLTGCPHLMDLDVTGCRSLTALDLSSCAEMGYLFVSDTALEELDLLRCLQLRYLDASDPPDHAGSAQLLLPGAAESGGYPCGGSQNFQLPLPH